MFQIGLHPTADQSVVVARVCHGRDNYSLQPTWQQAAVGYAAHDRLPPQPEDGGPVLGSVALTRGVGKMRVVVGPPAADSIGKQSFLQNVVEGDNVVTEDTTALANVQANGGRRAFR
jgi:hypothetical protein